MIGCSGHTLLEWVKKAEVNSGKRAGVSTELADRLKALEREHRELRQANEILRKASEYRRGPWRSFEAVEYATLEWVDWFNNRRLLAPIGNIPPAEAEERYYAMLDDTPMAA
jgi:hypothetical protein